MSEQYVYRYNDVNRVGDGHAQVELLRRVVIKETEHYVWSVPEPLPWNGVPGVLGNLAYYWSHPKQSNYYPKKIKKNADRSAWHVTKEQALAAWYVRKGYQLARLRLMLERVELCMKGIKEQGIIEPVNMSNTSPLTERIKQTPDFIECGAGPVLSEYCWQEY